MSTPHSLAPNEQTAQSVSAYICVLVLIVMSMAILCLPRLPPEFVDSKEIAVISNQNEVASSVEKYALAKGLYMETLRTKSLIQRNSAHPETNNQELSTVPITESLWNKVVNSGGMEPVKHDSIAIELNSLIQNKFWIEKNLNMAKPYLGYVVQILEKRDLPLSLALIPVIESNYNPNAKSENNAIGLWQFIPHTGEALGLDINNWVDERRSISRSTEVALDYFESLYSKFDSWPLAIAAYNAGPSRIRSKIRKTGLQKATVWDLDLPTETSRYVAKFFALYALLSNAQTYGLSIPNINKDPVFSYIKSPVRISLFKAAALALVSIDDLLQYNGSLLTQSTPPDGPHIIAIPTKSISIFKENLTKAVADDEILYDSIVYYVVKAGDILGEIALKHNTTINKLRLLNGLSSSKITIGQELMIFSHKAAEEETQIPPEYRVKRGDTLSAIAERFGVNSSTLIKDNKINNANLVKTGKILVIPAKYNPRSIAELLTYTVKAGDTLSTIAEKFDVQLGNLKEINPLIASSNTLFTGQTLTIPTKNRKAK